MLPQSSIAKGKRGEKLVCERIEAAGLGAATRTPGSGNGLKKGDIFSGLPFLIEVKNRKEYQWWKYVDEVKDDARKGNWDPDKWAIVVYDPRTAQDNPNLYVLIDFQEFLSLLKRNEEPKVKEPDRSLKWALQKLRQACREVEGQLE